jgi:hypothetical protein
VNLQFLTRINVFAGALALTLVLPSSSLPATVDPTARQDSAEVSRLLSEARIASSKLVVTTDEFHSYTRSRLDWRTHAEKVHQLKDNVNVLGATLLDLEAIRSQAAPWQQDAIEKMRPILVALAKNAKFVIQHINENQKELRHSEYRDALANNQELASQLAGLTDDFVTYGETKGKLEELRTKLELN